MPLLAPWANRLHDYTFDVSGQRTDVRTPRTRTDAQGLPIHGWLVGSTGWQLVHRSSTPQRCVVEARRDVSAPGFPFPHHLEVGFALAERRMEVTTILVADQGSSAPLAFGWHPYLRLPGVPRPQWRLGLPDREHLLLDECSLPTGVRRTEMAEDRPLATRHFDDLYEVGRRYGALEPLTVPTDAMACGAAPMVPEGSSTRCVFAFTV